MTAIQTMEPRERVEPLDRAEPRRGALPTVTVSAFSECTCPGDCDRDHDNE